MIHIVQQTIDYFIQHGQKPSIENIEVKDTNMVSQKAKVFVTLYKNWEIRWASGNVQEIHDNLVEELIENTIQALSKDERFDPVVGSEAKDIKIRVDLIENRTPLKDNELKTLDPTKYGVLAIEKKYTSMAVILPNMNPKLITGEDFWPIISEKCSKKSFLEADYILYKLETLTQTNY